MRNGNEEEGEATNRIGNAFHNNAPKIEDVVVDFGQDPERGQGELVTSTVSDKVLEGQIRAKIGENTA